jgi:PiT family inorganic phosphate transporter
MQRYDTVDTHLALLIGVLGLGLVFEFVNGFHDAANAIATAVATRVLRPAQAVLMAGVLNFAGAVTGTAVATTVGQGLVDPHVVTQATIAAGLVAGIGWDFFTWRLGMPTSSSHALLFGVLGAGVATGGLRAIVVPGVVKVGIGIGYSPIIALLAAGAVIVALYWLFYRNPPARITRVFGRLQLLSSMYMAFSHGGNDGQKTMGIMSLALFTYGALGPRFYVPLWVMALAACAMGLGTAAGGWRIVKTMGFRLTKLHSIDGFAAETAAATTIEVATRLGIPISTTHAINGAILGVGATKGVRWVRWSVARNIVLAWVMTLPACFALGWALMRLAAALGL